MAQEYYRKVMKITDFTFIGQTMALAKDVGIVDTLVNAEKPLTSREIADRKQLKERYVREILGCLAGAELFLLSTNEDGVNVYCMNEDQKRGLDIGYAKYFSGFISPSSERYARIKECIYKSGPRGFLYGDKIMDIVAENAVKDMQIRLIKSIESVPGLEEKLERGIDVIEFASGRGIDIIYLAKKYPNSKFTGSDLDDANFLRSKQQWENLPNLSFRVIDVCKMDGQVNQLYDWGFVLDAIHDVPDPGLALTDIRKVIKKPGGVLTLVEPSSTENGTHQEAVGNPLVAAQYGLSLFMCIVEGDSIDDSKALGPCGGRKVMRDLLVQAGFDLTTYEILNEFYTLYICT